jgi:hypothetical protein
MLCGGGYMTRVAAVAFPALERLLFCNPVARE